MENHTTIETFTTSSGVFAMDVTEDKRMLVGMSAELSHQQEAFDVLSSFLKKGSLVVDVGAHIGTFSIPQALQGRTVIAFEPSPKAFTLLKKNADLNQVHIDSRNKGLGAAASQAAIREGDGGNAGSRSLIEGEGIIEIARLDDEVSHADAIKIDVEGMELGVLHGAEKLIQSSKPVILFEVHLSQMSLYGATPSAEQAFLRSHGYDLYVLINSKGRMRLGKVWSLSFAALCLAPGTVFFGRESYPFDVLAVPKARAMPMPYLSAFGTHIYIAGDKIIDVTRRIFRKLYK